MIPAMNLTWDEEICLRPYTPSMELPEDVLYMFIKKQPKLQELIDKFELIMEY